MKISTGGMELLASETFLAIGIGETVITMGEGADALRFILAFERDDADVSSALTHEPVDGKALKLILTNWNNPLGTTLVQPLKVGIFHGRQLFMLFNIRKSGGEGQTREVTFSLYLGEVVQSGPDHQD